MTASRRRRLSTISAAHAKASETAPAGMAGGNHLPLPELLILIDAGTWREGVPLVTAYAEILGFPDAQAMRGNPALAAERHRAALARVLAPFGLTTLADASLVVLDSLLAKAPPELRNLYEMSPGVRIWLSACDWMY